VIKGGDVDVCLKDPGHEVELHIFTDVKTLTGVWMGDLSLGKSRRLTVPQRDAVKPY